MAVARGSGKLECSRLLSSTGVRYDLVLRGTIVNRTKYC